MKRFFLAAAAATVLMSVASGFGLRAQEAVNPQVEKVHVIFKTHLDVGFTDLPSKVEQKYIDNFIPRAIEVANRLKAEGENYRYVWTTGSWLIDAYLKQATPEAVSELEAAIRRGDIVWNGVPYTFESEAATRELFETTLQLAKRLDGKYGKRTIAAKMTDVPGHTRSVITPLAEAGIRMLHVGVNPASSSPDIPPICRWKNTDGREIILMYQNTYGSDMPLPDGKTVLSINFTADNIGPHTPEQVKAIYAELKKRYPGAKIVASSLNGVAEDLLKMADRLPELTSEIGDTWIYGYASDPAMMARCRALMRLYSEWLKQGKLKMKDDTAIDFAVQLGLVPEHTWGVDIKTFVKNWDRYDVEAFNAGRGLPEFRMAELSWKEKADRIDQAVALLPDSLQREAKAALESVKQDTRLKISRENEVRQMNASGAVKFAYRGMECSAGEVAWQTYSADDYVAYRKAYLSSTPDWSYGDFGKPGLENSRARNATLVARRGKAASRKAGEAELIGCVYAFPESAEMDARILPQEMNVQYVVSGDGKSIDMTVSLVGKPAVRLPEACWLSFYPAGVSAVLAEKMGMPVDVLDVVEGGNRQMHAIDRYMDAVTPAGRIRITSLDAPVVAVGERRALNYSRQLPDLNGGIHFCLFNNLWGTNFTAWWEGSIAYRFRIEFMEKTNE
ncbi:MAG: DUF5054 domain-containing protein [Tannerella sp.]|jgi:hypothetical protein|nr:DUF5054 domain-containing protein [Tannerella sp.]